MSTTEALAAADASAAPSAGPTWIDRAAWVAERLIPVIMAEFPDAVPERDDRGVSAHHLLFMAQTLARKELDSPTKACRWLGWLQCAVSIICDRDPRASLEEMKELNMASWPALRPAPVSPDRPQAPGRDLEDDGA